MKCYTVFWKLCICFTSTVWATASESFVRNLYEALELRNVTNLTCNSNVEVYLKLRKVSAVVFQNTGSVFSRNYKFLELDQNLNEKFKQHVLNLDKELDKIRKKGELIQERERKLLPIIAMMHLAYSLSKDERVLPIFKLVNDVFAEYHMFFARPNPTFGRVLLAHYMIFLNLVSSDPEFDAIRRVKYSQLILNLGEIGNKIDQKINEEIFQLEADILDTKLENDVLISSILPVLYAFKANKDLHDMSWIKNKFSNVWKMFYLWMDDQVTTASIISAIVWVVSMILYILHHIAEVI